MNRLMLSALAVAGAALAACATVGDGNSEAIRQGAMEQCAAIGRANDEACIDETMLNMRAARRYDPNAGKGKGPPR